jgi:cytochrome c oxidase subunit 3
MNNSDISVSLEGRKELSMHPQKFAVWLFIIAICMMFAGMTSAYIVKQSEGNWLMFDLPIMFVYSSIIVVLSSITMHWSFISAKRDNLTQIRLGVLLTTILGFSFLVSQYLGWVALVDSDVFFVGNAAGSFIYVFSGLHGFHLVSGIIFLLIVLSSALKFKIHSKSLVLIEMCTTYWHFLGGLWLYLYLFLIVNN